MLSQTIVFTELVRDHMDPAPVHCTESDACQSVVARMHEADATSAVVVGADQKPAGIITQRDICWRAAFRIDPETPARSIMSAPVHTVGEGEYLYRAVAEMRRHRLRHMPAINRHGQVTGLLSLDTALAGAAGQIVHHIDCLSRDTSFEGLCETKAAQKEVALELLNDTVPTPEIQWLLTSINMVLHHRVAAMCVEEMHQDGYGDPPVAFDVIVMGSGGRGESYLNPDQDNGIILQNHPESEHESIDQWFVEFAKRKTDYLEQVGFEKCIGKVMSTNPRWRKTLDGFCQQTLHWIEQASGDALHYCDIFFDFRHCYGEGQLTTQLRNFVTEAVHRRHFLNQLYRLNQEHRGALNWLGHLTTSPNPGDHAGKIDLKTGGTLPLVQTVRLLALEENVAATSTRERMSALNASGAMDDDEYDYLSGAHEHISNLLLRQQLNDFSDGLPINNYVPPDALSQREEDMLIASFKALRRFHSRVGKLLLKGH